MGNTVGRRSNVDLAYIAGFLDGDGSIMLQLHRREKGKDSFRIKTVICLYQDCRHCDKLEWMKEILECGYVYTRNEGTSELRIEGFQRVFETLVKLKPSIRFKKPQVDLMLELIPKIQQKLILKEEIVSWIKTMRKYNYYSSQRSALVDVPVTT